MKLLSRIRSLWSALRARKRFEAELDEEFRTHTELRARDLERHGLSKHDALRRARQEFGSPARYKEETRAAVGLHRIDFLRFSALDFKVGLRMLARYPGLTIVGVMAIAVAMALGTIYFEAINKWRNPRVPLPEGDRVVTIRNYDVLQGSADPRALHDFATWKDQVRSIRNLGAAITFERNLITADRRIEPVRGAEVTPSAFALTRTPPLMGRPLQDADQNIGVGLVAVISEQLWRTRFDSDPQVLGRAVKVGTLDATIVGVMPPGFGFPVSEKLWLPLRMNGALLAPRSGPGVQLFGRLADGVSHASAQAELDAISNRMSTDHPDTHKNLRLRLQPYGEPALSQGGEAAVVRTVLYSLNVVFGMLLIIVCANVGTLVFARTATRGWEITVRNALGASRARILSQLFIEALVLASIATALGLLAAKVAFRFGVAAVSTSGNFPFWMRDDIAPVTVLYAGLLTLIAATIIGVLPALRMTRPAVQDSLRREGAARSGLKFGGFWTGVIIVQVAITVAFITIAAGGYMQANRFEQRAESIGAHRFLATELALSPESAMTDSAAFAGRARNTFVELMRRLSAEPGIQAAAYATRLPGEDQFKYPIALDTTVVPNDADALRTSTAVKVGPGFFEAFETEVIAGRDFVPSDYENGRVVIVNQSFARLVFGDRNPIGQRLRYPESAPFDLGDGGPKEASVVQTTGGPTDGQWYEVVGMIRDYIWTLDAPQEKAAIYHPVMPAGGTISLALRMQGDPASFAPRLRSIAASVDPALRLYNVTTLDKIGGGEARINWILTGVAALVTFMVLLLSATGIHSLMAFTVARRTREIGIRTALGANPRRIVSGIFSRAFLQLSIGVIAGCGIASIWGINGQQVMMMMGAVAIMMTVGLAACWVPMRRALRVDPTEALRAET